MTGEVRISFYAGCYEAMGQTEITHPLPKNCTVEKFVDAVIETYPALRRLRRLIVCAREKEYLEPEDQVRPGDHIQMMSALT